MSKANGVFLRHSVKFLPYTKMVSWISIQKFFACHNILTHKLSVEGHILNT